MGMTLFFYSVKCIYFLYFLTRPLSASSTTAELDAKHYLLAYS